MSRGGCVAVGPGRCHAAQMVVKGAFVILASRFLKRFTTYLDPSCR